MRVTWKQFESFIKSRNYDQLLEIILDVSKENKELQQEIFFKFDAVEDFSPEDYDKIIDEINDIKIRLYRSLDRYHRVNRKTLSNCQTELEEIFKKKVKPLARKGYYIYTLNLTSSIFNACEEFLSKNPTKRLEKFEASMKNFLLDLIDKMSIEDFIIFLFNLNDIIDKYEFRNLKELREQILSDEGKLTKLEEKTQKWLDEHYIDDLTTTLKDNEEYNNMAVFNAYLKDNLGLPNDDMKDKFINCFGVRNYFIDKLYNNKQSQELIDYSKKIRKLKNLEDEDLESLNLALIDIYDELGDQKHLMDELEYNISTYDQENLEMLTWYLSFLDKSERKEQADWFMGGKPFQNHNYNKYFIDQVAQSLKDRKFEKIKDTEILEYYRVLSHLFPKEIAEYFMWFVQKDLKQKKLPEEEYKLLSTYLELAAKLDEKKVKEFARDLVKEYPGRKYLKHYLNLKELA